jgi:hypothetical protein
MNGALLLRFDGVLAVDGFTEHIEHTAK